MKIVAKSVVRLGGPILEEPLHYDFSRPEMFFFPENKKYFRVEELKEIVKEMEKMELERY